MPLGPGSSSAPQPGSEQETSQNLPVMAGELANLSAYFKFPQKVRRLIYTTNTIEGFNRQLRKVTKSKSVFPTDDSLLKMHYLTMVDITKKWAASVRTGA